MLHALLADDAVLVRGRDADVLLDIGLAERPQLQAQEHRTSGLLLARSQLDLTRRLRVDDAEGRALVALV